MQNNQNQKLKGTAEIVSVELKEIAKEREALLRREKRKKFDCDHKDDYGRSKLEPAGSKGWKCTKCESYVDITVLSIDEVERKLADVINICDCIKLMGNPELVKMVSSIEEGVDSLSYLYESVVLRNGRKKKGNNNNNINQRRASYGSSKL